MSLLGRITRGAGAALEARDAGTFSEPGASLREFVTGAATYSGKRVTNEGALALVPVYSAVALLSGAIAQLPLNVYQQTDRGRVLAPQHRTWRLLHDQPNDLMAADEFQGVIAASLALWGNAFVAKGYGPDGAVNELVPLKPSRVQVGYDGSRREPYYLLDGKATRYTRKDVLHVRGLSSDGLIGYSPIQVARQALGTSLALDEYAGRFWNNNARPGVILRHPNKLTPEAAKRLKSSWDSAHGGLANIAKTAVLEEGMDVSVIGMPLQDAQLVEQMRLTDIRVAQLFRIPPALLLANPGTSLTYSTTEGQGIDFLRWTLGPWLRRLEGALLADPYLFTQGARFVPGFATDALLRSDLKARADTAVRLVDAGILTPNEGREVMERNPLDGDEYDVPREPRAPAAPAAGEGDTTTEGEAA